jgi:hypothetical protein
MANMWLCIAPVCAVPKGSDQGPSLCPHHTDVGILDGAECLGHAMCIDLAADLDAILLSPDCHKSFRTILREDIFIADGEHAPSLLPFLQWA